jgi:starch-binding outer membrane protein, SusD/RagB family
VKNFTELFLDEGNSEVIFYFPFIGQGYSKPNSGYDMHFGPYSKVAWGGSKAQPFLETVEWFENKDGSPGTFDRTKFTAPGTVWSYEELWGNKDPRFFASVFTMETPWQGDIVKMYNGIIQEDGTLSEGTDNYYKGYNSMGPDARDSRGKTGFSVKKYLKESRIRPDNYQSDQDWPSIRLAEIKLNKAEAAIELGKTGDALQEVNDIRARAGIAPLTSIDLEKVRNERRVELAFEGFRFFDLRRWRIADKVIDTRVRQYTNLRYILDYKSTQTGEAWKYRIQLVNSGNDDLYKIFDPKLYYYPITQNRIANNKNLVENPGY